MQSRRPSFIPDASDANKIQTWYDNLQTGEFRGNPPILQWIGPDMWVHYPDEHFPFGFIRHNGDQYILGRFSTDGGSIPQVMQALPGMTAWHFGAAYLIHDWIWYLHQKHEASISMEESNIILCEAIKTLIEKGYLSHVEFNGDAGTVYNIWRGVQSPFARKKWREYGKRQ